MATVREIINQYAENWKAMMIDTTKTWEDIEKAGFSQATFEMGFGSDGGRKFIAMNPDTMPFYYVEDLEKIIDDFEDVNAIGTAIEAKWMDCFDFDAETRYWFILMLNRMSELTGEKEAMSIQELSALLKEHRDEIIEHTEASAWDVDLWIAEPLEIMNMDSGIGYDVCSILGIEVEEIIDAVNREQMFMNMVL